ncbi:hypothetical protein GH714_012573 [Hevea brasiliensis]|uniref:C2H2-type domain-containing protein n=1 Tax=Hevea brasiliensis TaxID=3981 RepID=A0A6A6ML00_HEVBR|nr:hypothetical protein GH714_012573 [Hevea brasiliensis]
MSPIKPSIIGQELLGPSGSSVPFPHERELFNYYFNVFMLRRRSEQNRFDPLNIDSDNDEWQRNEAGMAEEDEDSGVESLNGQDGIAYYQEGHDENCNEPIEDDYEIGASRESAAAADVQRVATDEEYEGDLDDISEAHVGISTDDCGGDVGFKLFRGISCNKRNDFDIEDGSCTSYECQRDNVDSCGPLDIVNDGRHSGQYQSLFHCDVALAYASGTHKSDRVMEQRSRKEACVQIVQQEFLEWENLGGHMRIHVARDSAKEEVKLENGNLSIEGYGLRENPKKSWKSSGLNHNDSVSVQESLECRVCGKQFEFPRSLHGHMRHHSVEERKGIRCKECGKGFRTLRSLTGHMRLHSDKYKVSRESMTGSRPSLVVMTLSDTGTAGLVRRKRSIE